MSVVTPPADNLRPVDRELLVAMRDGEEMTIGELTEKLGVTATAVRQRIERLLASRLIDRQKTVAGRGRPTFRYHITIEGHRRAGASPVNLADALWREMLAIEDETLKQHLLSSVAARLGRQYASVVSDSVQEDDPLEVRMKRLTEVFAAQQMEVELSHQGQLPVLDIGSCPYPSLTDASDDRAMCRLEEKMISEALGKPVHLSSCRLDGDSCCQFTAKDSGEPTAS
ncbi:MAG: MarR family transcriptional regulator [Planctomycetota bacterium]